MTESKYGKYVVTDVSKITKEGHLGTDKAIENMFIFINDDVIKGSWFFRPAWFWGVPTGKRRGIHVHEWDELLGFFGTGSKDVHDLGGEIHFYIEDEVQVLTKSTLIFLPKGLKHGPLNIIRVDRPIFHFSSGLSGKYTSGTKLFGD